MNDPKHNLADIVSHRHSERDIHSRLLPDCLVWTHSAEYVHSTIFYVFGK